MDGITVLPIKHKKYVLCFAGNVRRNKVYDVLCPSGEQIGTRLNWDDAVRLAKNDHYKKFPPQRKSRPGEVYKFKPLIDYKEAIYEDFVYTNIRDIQTNGDFE